MSFYSNLRETAAGLLKNYGAKIVFTRTVKGLYDTTTGRRLGDTTTTFKGNGVLLDYKKNQYDGSTILHGDARLILEATKKVPIIGDHVTVNGVVYDVISVNVTSPAGEHVVTECQLRSGVSGTIR